MYNNYVIRFHISAYEYKYGAFNVTTYNMSNIVLDCGRVHNMKNQVTPEESNQSIIALAPWTVAVYEKNADSKFDFICPGSIIAPNIVISGKALAQCNNRGMEIN